MKNKKKQNERKTPSTPRFFFCLLNEENKLLTIKEYAFTSPFPMQPTPHKLSSDIQVLLTQ